MTLSCDSNITLGKVHKKVHDLERKGHYLGKTVQSRESRRSLFFSLIKKEKLLSTFLILEKYQHKLETPR